MDFRDHELILDDGLHFRRTDIAMFEEALPALYKLYATRKYLFRCWTVQEVVFSYRAFVLSGESLIPIQQLGTIAHIMDDSRAAKVLEQKLDQNSGSGAECPR